MFVGHYGATFAAKRGDGTIPLWVLFVGVQLLVVFWSLFVFGGIEKVRIVPRITASNPLDLYYMPYTHSFVAALLWSLAAYVAYRAIRAFGASHRAALLVALAVFSHWALDLVVHRPDLPLYDNAAKVGLGLWNYPAPAFLLEVAVPFGGMLLYLGSTTATTRLGRYGMPMFGVVMLAVQAFVFFGPPPSSDRAAAVTALGSYFLFAAVAGWLARRRAGRRLARSPLPCVGPSERSYSILDTYRRRHMRTLLCTAIALAACAPGDRSRASTSAGPARKYAGTWEGRSFRSASDTGTPWRIVTAVASDGSLRGTMTYTSVTAPPVPIRARDVSDSAVVSELGPYHSIAADADVVTTTTGKLRGDSLNGTFEMRPAGGVNVIMSGNFRSKRVVP